MTLIPMLATAAELTIDHVTVAGKDLKAMRAKLAEAGIPSEYGGPHSNHATEMALTSFADAAKTHEVIFAADKSAATGKSVRL